MKLIGLPQFQKALNDYAAKVNAAPVKIAKKATVALIGPTVRLTRVDTGRLRAGWMVSWGASPSFGKNTYDDGISRKNQDASISQSVINSQTEKAASWDGSGGIIWLANNVDYAEPREFGRPSEAGDYMLTQAIAQVTANIVRLAQEAMRE